MKKNNSSLKKAQTALLSGQFVKAINICEKLIKLDPLNVDCLLTLGEAYLRNEQFQEALIPCAKVIELDNSNIRGLNNFGAALLRNHQHSDAKEILEYGLELEPNNFDILINVCNAYQGLGQPEKSLQTALRAIEVSPGAFMAYNNLGTALGDLLRIEDARQAYITANVLNPNYLPTIINLAQLEVKLGDHHRGVQLYESALKLKDLSASYAELIKYYLSHSYLFLGELEKGWDYYDFGFCALLPKGAWRSLRRFNQPRWNGDLNDKTLRILVWREQGLGDEIEFSTCLKDLYDADMNVILECDPRLVNIYQRAYPKFIVRSESVDLKNYPMFNDFDVQYPLGSLPRLFRRRIEDFQKQFHLWIPDDIQVADIKERLKPYKDKILVGISWRSGVLKVERNTNYTNLTDWHDLLKLNNLQFVNLQYGDCEEELISVEQELGIQILRWSDIDLRNDLEAVLALVSELDCVCSVGTAVSSLAACAGVPTLLLLQKSWILLGETENYPWYCNVKPFVVDPNMHVGSNINNLSPYIVKRNR
jgi:tetratricopeptide (TPR) repeat protein